MSLVAVLEITPDRFNGKKFITGEINGKMDIILTL